MSRLWRLWETDLPKGWFVDIAQKTCTARIYLVTEHRWAFGRLRHAFPLASLSLVEAKQRIERMRSAGSWWTIEELPVCAFIGRKYSLLIAMPKAGFVQQTYSAAIDPFLS